MPRWLNFLKRAPKEAPAPVPATPKGNGFFATDMMFDPMPRDELLGVLSEQVFQRTHKDLRAVSSDGTTMVAMDEAYQDLTLSKMENSLGGWLPETQFIWFASQSFVGYQTCAMISQNWLIDKAITMPARDAVRHGYTITSTDGKELTPEMSNAIRLADKKRGIKDQCVEFVRFGRMFGIRVAMFQIESRDPDYYAKPFNADSITPGSYIGISQIDPYWITPELDAKSASDPSSIHFYEPTWWRVNGRRVHRTHLIIMRNGGELPDILKPTYFYGGIPLPQKIAERVYAAERTANEAPQLAMTKRMTVLNVDITKATANESTFQQKMAQWTAIMNNYGVKVVGEDEKIEQFDTSLNDLDVVIMTQYQIVAAIAEVPATKLLGTSPKGFGASGEYEESSYHEFLESIQEHDLSPLVERHHLCQMLSDVAPSLGVKPVETEIAWKPTDSPTAKEMAEINKLIADTDNTLQQAGAIDGTDIRERIADDPDSGYGGIEKVVPDGPGDREAQQEAEAALEQPVTQRQAKSNAQDAVEGEYYDPADGTLGGAQLITHQSYLSENITKQKLADKDFTVYTTPAFEVGGKKYRVIIDGHHSLAAAIISKVTPTFIDETLPDDDSVLNAVKRTVADSSLT